MSAEYSVKKNAFTADGGPHKVARILAVADGLRRIGEFESAEMLTAYAERIKADEGAVPVAWFRNIVYIGEPAMFGGIIGRTGIDCEIVAGKDKPPQKDLPRYAARNTNPDWRPLYLHPPVQAAQVGISDADVELACKAASMHADGAVFPDAYGDEEAEMTREFMRVALRAVWSAASVAAEPAAQGEAVKRWPFVESPGEFTSRLQAAMREFPLLGAVCHVLIEDPPTLAAQPRAVPDAPPGGVLHAIDQADVALNMAGLGDKDIFRIELKQAREVIAAMLTTPPTQPTERVVDGWKSVPREPTDAMLKAGTDVPLYGQFYPGHTADESEYVNEQYHAAARRGQIYAAMLAAAPSPGESA